MVYFGGPTRSRTRRRGKSLSIEQKDMKECSYGKRSSNASDIPNPARRMGARPICALITFPVNGATGVVCTAKVSERTSYA